MDNNSNDTENNFIKIAFQQNESKNMIFQKAIISEVIKKNNSKLLYIKIIILIIFFLFNYYHKTKNYINKIQRQYDVDFNYINYDNNLLTNKIIQNAGWELEINQAYFINGLIRKYRPKKCLEIGVSNGGSSILILNAIEDIPNSNLISLDLNVQLYSDRTKRTGYRVNK